MTLETLLPSRPGDGTSALASMAPTPPTLTLRAFVDRVASAVRTGVPRDVWVEAAIVGVRRRGGGYALELGENVATHAPAGARLETYLPDRSLAAVRQKLGLLDLDPSDLEKASAIVRLTVNFHARFHLQGIVQDINPAIGDSLLAKHLDRIRARLRAENLLLAQSRLPKPVDIRRLAVIHPEGAASWADVAKELGRLQGAGVFDVIDFAAPFEGPSAVPSLLKALRAARDLPALDALMIVRGGGASSGLATLANEELARAVCTFSVPVLTGIGHATGAFWMRSPGAPRTRQARPCASCSTSSPSRRQQRATTGRKSPLIAARESRVRKSLFTIRCAQRRLAAARLSRVRAPATAVQFSGL